MFSQRLVVTKRRLKPNKAYSLKDVLHLKNGKTIVREKDILLLLISSKYRYSLREQVLDRFQNSFFSVMLSYTNT